MKRKNITHQYVGFAIGIATMILIGFFLKGKIIDIPNGTHEGGIISGIGVLVIIITMALIGIGARLWIDKRKIKNSK